MSFHDLVFTGFNKRVAALHRDTGEIVWQWTAPSGDTYTSLLLDGDRLIVSVHRYMYALDAATGRQLWANDMRGFGFGVASLASARGSLGSSAGSSTSAHIVHSAWHHTHTTSSST
ncbi:PQQ-binding-like beta-propeller repeat protein [Prosthecobacter sp.]|uniref:outer membrane protein assembly factor BamB family protein n=1 Tax=Prosthecobacter sp. TaxID=1965333 RepID=UPI00378369D8